MSMMMTKHDDDEDDVRERFSQRNWVGVRGPLPKPLLYLRPKLRFSLAYL